MSPTDEILSLNKRLLDAIVAAHGAGALLFGIQPTDPITLFGAAMFLALVAIVASFLPAHSATRVDPMIALRYE